MADLTLSDRIAEEYALGKLDIKRGANLPGIATPTLDLKSVRDTVMQIKQLLDTRENRVGSVLDKNLTFRDLMDSSTLRVQVGPDTFVGNAAASLTINSTPFGDTRPTLTTPPTLTTLAASATMRQILLTWSRYAYANHAYTEVYRHTSDAIGSAVKIGTATADIYDDSSGVSGVTYFYWVRAVNTSGQHGAFNATSGVSAALGTIAGVDLTDLIITSDKLSQGTYPGINLVPNAAAEDGTRAWSLTWDTGLGTLANDTTIKAGGTQGFKLTKASSGIRAGAGCFAFPVIPGETYAWRFKWRGSSATGSGHLCRAYERTSYPTGGIVTGALATSVTELTGSVGITTSFVELKGNYVVPAGVVWVSIGFLNDTTNTNLDIYWDDVSVGRQITAEQITAASITAAKMVTGTITAASGIIGDLTADVITAGTLAAARIAAGSLDANKITAGTITADRMVAGVLSADNVLTRSLTVRDSVGNIILSAGSVMGSGNLFVNGDMILGSPIPTNLAAYNNGAFSRTDSIVAGLFPNTNAYQFINNAAVVSNNWGFFFNNAASAFGGYKANTTYVISFYAKCSAPGGNKFAAAWNNGPATQYFLQNPVLTTAYQRYVFVLNFGNNTIDANGFFYLDTGNLAISTTTTVTALQFEQGDFPSGWSTPPVTGGNPISATNVGVYIASAAITSAYIGSLNADVITSGSIRGISLVGSTHATKGSYLTTSASAAATTLTLKDTTDFHSSGGTVHFMDTTNDRDVATYTGKTATTLTGCSGVLAHSSGAFVVPVINNGTHQKSIALNDLTNEARFWGNRGDGTTEELASIGLKAADGTDAIGSFGSTTTTIQALVAACVGNIAISGSGGSGGTGVRGLASSGIGLEGESVVAGTGVKGTGATQGFLGSSTSGWGGRFDGNATKGSLYLPVLAARPSDTTVGSIYVGYTTGGSTDARTATPRLMVADGTNWRQVHDDGVFAG